MTKKYIEEGKKLEKAIDIAIESFKKYPPKDFNQENLDHVIKCYLEFKDSIFKCEPQFLNLSSLKYTISDVFTYFLEGSGPNVEFFWKKIKNNNLDYERKNPLDKILKRGKIKNDIEYQLVIDMIPVAEQSGLISKDQEKALSEMLGKYEN